MSDNINSEFDPFLTAIISNRVEGIVREMTFSLQRAARSAVISSARDFSCSICTGQNELLAAAEGLPIHIFGSHMQTKTMTDFHEGDIHEGDCYLHNDPYTGNTHAGDHTYLVPVFFEGEHMFTTVVKAHQADIGNALPTTLDAGAVDQYAEGALIFPAVRVQRNYEMVEDVVRMCRSRIRVPSQWYGDFLAGIGAARVGERRLKALCEKYGRQEIKTFIRNWLSYSESRMEQSIRKLPKLSMTNTGTHDRFGTLLPDGIPLKGTVEIRPEDGMIDIDLTENIDNVPCGFNMTEACVQSASVAGVFNSIDPTIPRNSGSFRRINVEMREGAVVGKPKFPHSCSLGTTNLADRLVNLVQSAFAQIDANSGLAEGGLGMGAGIAVVSGKDERSEDGTYVNMLIMAGAGGPGAPSADGWPTYGLPVIGGLMYRDSIEIDELKHPIRFRFLRIVPGTAGAGRYRGAPATELAYGPTTDPMQAIWPCDGTYNPSKGVRGGLDGTCARHFHVSKDGEETELPNVVDLQVKVGEYVHGNHATGGGYGDPKTRAPQRVLHDVMEGYETLERARTVYAVALTGTAEDETLAVDQAATTALRTANS
ncbi:hydantoinase B/oxoprolinase family protein [uncultured Nitratireductor sp.]|uniref:hydantoinase B/oxoprolinase family protein n=1 Tax=uncultured Nitratireductor sp. TaxID=520953 RepID=UPI0026164E45|nr:hydantoinase B/oxoprolinase family protein [uncultured Nitratireductor sp.]